MNRFVRVGLICRLAVLMRLSVLLRLRVVGVRIIFRLLVRLVLVRLYRWRDRCGVLLKGRRWIRRSFV